MECFLEALATKCMAARLQLEDVLILRERSLHYFYGVITYLAGKRLLLWGHRDVFALFLARALAYFSIFNVVRAGLRLYLTQMIGH